MSAIPIFLPPVLAQAGNQTAKPKTNTTVAAAPAVCNNPPIWMYASGGLLLLLVALGAYSKISYAKAAKQLKFETFKNRELQKKLK
ncbi:MAG: hypothetical protein NW224_17455 [Leptolyngbyaceae cyanobacterium bins.302]|nr:hypothetical protein [Leptolyngbyaceae cyanobacterium bins.302]